MSKNDACPPGGTVEGGGALVAHGADFMGEKMNRAVDGKQEIVRGHLRLERGIQPNRVRPPFEGQWDLDREMQAAFVAFEGEDGTVPSKGVYSIRALDARPWLTLGRRFIEARNAGVPLASVLAVLRVFEVWVRGMYSVRLDRPA